MNTRGVRPYRHRFEGFERPTLSMLPDPAKERARWEEQGTRDFLAAMRWLQLAERSDRMTRKDLLIALSVARSSFSGAAGAFAAAELPELAAECKELARLTRAEQDRR